jgi:hypothetical protein
MVSFTSWMAFWMPSTVKRTISVCNATLSCTCSCSTLGGGARPLLGAMLARLFLKKVLISSQLATRKIPRDQMPREASRKALAERMWSSCCYRRQSRVNEERTTKQPRQHTIGASLMT